MAHRTRSQKKQSRARHARLNTAAAELVVVEAVPATNPNPSWGEFEYPAGSGCSCRIVRAGEPVRYHPETGWYQVRAIRRDVVVGALRAQTWPGHSPWLPD
jgi:hypothetical protein